VPAGALAAVEPPVGWLGGFGASRFFLATGDCCGLPAALLAAEVLAAPAGRAGGCGAGRFFLATAGCCEGEGNGTVSASPDCSGAVSGPVFPGTKGVGNVAFCLTLGYFSVFSGLSMSRRRLVTVLLPPPL